MEMKTKMRRFVKYVGFKTKEHSPEILIGAGIVGGVASAVIACKATAKTAAVKAEKEQALQDVKDCVQMAEEGTLPEGMTYTDEDAKRDTSLAYIKAGVGYAKVYAPAVALGTLSIASILAGCNIMRKRNLAVISAYNLVQKEFGEYRERVVDKFGEQVDKEMRFGTKEVEEEVVDEETGEKTIVKRTVTDTDSISANGFFFDEGCDAFTNDAEINLQILRRVEEECKFILKKDGYLTLNTVRTKLGLRECKRGAIFGWVDNPNLPEFSLGIYSNANMDFVNGREPYALIDPIPHGFLSDLLKIKY